MLKYKRVSNTYYYPIPIIYRKITLLQYSDFLDFPNIRIYCKIENTNVNILDMCFEWLNSNIGFSYTFSFWSSKIWLWWSSLSNYYFLCISCLHDTTGRKTYLVCLKSVCVILIFTQQLLLNQSVENEIRRLTNRTLVPG